MTYSLNQIRVAVHVEKLDLNPSAQDLIDTPNLLGRDFIFSEKECRLSEMYEKGATVALFLILARITCSLAAGNYDTQLNNDQRSYTARDVRCCSLEGGKGVGAPKRPNIRGTHFQR